MEASKSLVDSLTGEKKVIANKLDEMSKQLKEFEAAPEA
jgi:hypothetical protein